MELSVTGGGSFRNPDRRHERGDLLLGSMVTDPHGVPTVSKSDFTGVGAGMEFTAKNSPFYLTGLCQQPAHVLSCTRT